MWHDSENWNKEVAEEIRRELNRLNAKVENTNDMGYELSEILNDAVYKVECLLDKDN